MIVELALRNKYFAELDGGDPQVVTVHEDNQEDERNYLVISFDDTDFGDVTLFMTSAGVIVLKYYEEIRNEGGEILRRTAKFHRIGGTSYETD